MAKFGEVFTQMKRMCKANNECCAMCDLSGKCPANEIVENYDAGKIEKIVMQWAAEHPAPVYPTWWSWLINEGVIANGSTYTGAIDQLKMHTIPADIAEKLGLQPKK